MRLTKLQRYTAYCIMLAEINNYTSGFCELVRKELKVEIYATGIWDYRKFRTIFPELYSKRDTPIGWFLFSSQKYRIAALKECIKETEPK